MKARSKLLLKFLHVLSVPYQISVYLIKSQNRTKKEQLRKI